MGVYEVHEAAPLGERHAGSVERESRERQCISAAGRDERGAAGEHEAGGAAHADELRPRRQVQVAGTIDARAECQRHPPGRGLVDGCLQGARLIVGAAGAHAQMARIDPERRARSRGGAPRGERIGGGSHSGGRESE